MQPGGHAGAACHACHQRTLSHEISCLSQVHQATSDSQTAGPSPKTFAPGDGLAENPRPDAVRRLRRCVVHQPFGGVARDCRY